MIMMLSVATLLLLLPVMLQVLCGVARVNPDYWTRDDTRSFYIADDTFYKDGIPFRILGGDLHYFRVHPLYWADRLLRAKALGMNVIQTYVPWNLHQPRPDVLNFEDGANLEEYLRLVKKVGLLVMLRVGPYICGEWDFGGFPAWLLAVRPELRLRTSDSKYLNLVDNWWAILLPKIVPYLYCHGGPVIMIQVENEYGSFGADKLYMQHLVAKVKIHLGDDVIVYTTDGAVLENLEQGSLDGSDVYTAVDFPAEWDAVAAFALQKRFNTPGKSPLLSSEFYTGWLTHWGEALAHTDPSYTAAALDRVLSLNASVVLYMLHGGTNFGFTSGANTGRTADDFLPDITSYDYDAPIREDGDVDNAKFMAIRAVLKRHSPATFPDAPPLLPRKAFGILQLQKMSSLFDVLRYVSSHPDGIRMEQPSSMEMLHQISGLILYQTVLPLHTKPGSIISVSQVHDRAQVFISGTTKCDVQEVTFFKSMYIGTLDRSSNHALRLPAYAAVPGWRLDILVENMGRVNYGPHIYDPKGILSPVLMDQTPIVDWLGYPIPLDSKPPLNAESIRDRKQQLVRSAMTATFDRDAGNWTDGPSFYQGQLRIHRPADTHLSVVGWSKGVAFLNGYNLGRYWPIKGPQCTLYIPAPLLHVGVNELILLELDTPQIDHRVEFKDVPIYSCNLGHKIK